jgi:hypothetical protein
VPIPRKRVGIGIVYPDAKLQVKNWKNTRNITLYDLSDIPACTTDYGLFASISPEWRFTISDFLSRVGRMKLLIRINPVYPLPDVT